MFTPSTPFPFARCQAILRAVDQRLRILQQLQIAAATKGGAAGVVADLALGVETDVDAQAIRAPPGDFPLTRG